MAGNDTGDGAPMRDAGPDEAQHAARVHAAVLEQIGAAGGWISFEHYMDFVLYAPGLGYYSAGTHKLGTGGDFTTAPELSRLFGACVARQCAQVFEALAAGSILEVGAGSGQLAVDVLTRLEALGRLPDRYFILEVSADLRERQQRRIRASIPHLCERLSWLDALPAEPFDGVIVANEVLDALPVKRFRWSASGCEELGVSQSGGTLCWSARPAERELRDACIRLAAATAPWQDGYVSELCPRLEAWSAAIVERLRRGVVLWFDYGLPRRHYYLPERRDGTLICHFRHRAHGDPLVHPGLQDISAWVDFTALALAGERAGCELAGFTTQAFFLAGLGIDAELRRAAGDSEREFMRLAQEAKRLMLPGEMGESFKVMAWARDVDGELDGFALQDLRYSL